MKTQPITQKAKGSPFKLVQGAADLGASKDIYQKKETKPSPGNNQQPSNPPLPDLTDQGSKDDGKPKTDPKVKEENKVVEDYKPNDIVGFFNNILKN